LSNEKQTVDVGGGLAELEQDFNANAQDGETGQADLETTALCFEENLELSSELNLEPNSELSFEERLKHLSSSAKRNPLHREINYKTLKFCAERRILPEVEDFIAGCPEFKKASQSPYFLLLFLLKGGGIDTFELDEAGAVIEPAQKEGLTEDEIDDLIAQFAYQTNEVGLAFVEQMNPKNRLLEMLDIEPAYYETYTEVLEFLTEKRSMAEIDTLLRGREALMANRKPDDRPIQPSVFVDKLEKAGGIFWESGWIITPEGRELLATLEKSK